MDFGGFRLIGFRIIITYEMSLLVLLALSVNGSVLTQLDSGAAIEVIERIFDISKIMKRIIRFKEQLL